jgi:two-component system, LytTR family, response regulator
MKILLVDNEVVMRNTLKNIIQRMYPLQHEIEEAVGVEDGLDKIVSFIPDVVFLDIEMGDGTGFDLMKKVAAPSFQLIFVTAFNQYAIQAFKFSAIDYLLKPVDPTELSECLERAYNNMRQKNLHKQLEVMAQQIAGSNSANRKLVLRDQESMYFVQVSDILYCEAARGYTKFYLLKGNPILISKNLHAYEELLVPAGFIRTHHSCLVNPKYIKGFDRKTSSLLLEGGHTVPIAQRKRDSMIQYLESIGQ